MPFSIAFTDVVYIRKLDGIDGYGRPHYSSSITPAKCRVERVDNIQTSVQGEAKLVTFKIYSYHPFNTTDLIFLPNADTSDDKNGFNPLYVEKINAIGVGITTYEVAL